MLSFQDWYFLIVGILLVMLALFLKHYGIFSGHSSREIHEQLERKEKKKKK